MASLMLAKDLTSAPFCRVTGFWQAARPRRGRCLKAHHR